MITRDNYCEGTPWHYTKQTVKFEGLFYRVSSSITSSQLKHNRAQSRQMLRRQVGPFDSLATVELWLTWLALQ